MPVKYTVVSQAQSTEINPAGTGFHEVWNITYRVTDGPAKGTVATVTVPEDEHTPNDVDAAITAKIESLNGIANLGS